LLGSYALDRRCDCRGIIELGEFVLPGPMCLHMPLDVPSHVTEAVPLMLPCALGVHLAERALHRGGTRTVWRPPASLKARVTGQPLPDGFGCMHTVVIHNDIEARKLLSRGRRV
jgi:hypothetical protein